MGEHPGPAPPQQTTVMGRRGSHPQSQGRQGVPHPRRDVRQTALQEPGPCRLLSGRAEGTAGWWCRRRRARPGADSGAVTAVDEHRERQSPPPTAGGGSLVGAGGWRRSGVVPRQPGGASPEAAGGTAQAPGASGKSRLPPARSCPRVLRAGQSRRLAGGGSSLPSPHRAAAVA